MAILKCKICGGDMEISPDKTFGTCEYCGSTMTLPKIDDEQRAAAFNRGNHFRRSGEFDKALAVYEKIVEEDPNDAEAHWCCALCRFGIEWVEDPATTEYLPTCHRASFDPFTDDVDCKAALELSDGLTKKQYQRDASKIVEVQKGILATSQNEKPFDVFICYKETDENGNRTVDSTLAQDIYYQLTSEGMRVFFARITLEDKVGSEYEPYIFAALNSAKAMVVVGTRPENFNAVWVKNEWSRYLSIVKHDRRKVLLPCYRDMDPYDLPEQLSILQSYDMAKIGFIQDLIHGIKKIAKADAPKAEVKETVVVGAAGANVAPLLKRAFMFLEDGEWEKADEFCEQVLNQDPENAEAYLGKLMAEYHVKRQKDFPNCKHPFDQSNNYKKVVRFGSEKLAEELNGYIDHINERNETARLTGIYNGAVSAMNAANTEESYKAAAETFKSIPGFRDADDLVGQCLDKAEMCRKDAIYDAAKSQMEKVAELLTKGDVLSRFKSAISGYEEAFNLFRVIPHFKDADALAKQCREKAEACRKDEIYITAQHKMYDAKKALEKNVPQISINEYEEAIRVFSPISGWKDTDKYINTCQRQIEEIKAIKAKQEADRLERDRQAELRRIAAEKAAKKRKKIFAITTPIVVVCIAFLIVLTTVIIPSSKYNSAMELYNAQKYDDAYNEFNSLNYKDSADKAAECLFLKQKSGLTNVKAGSTIIFGFYEQDNNTSNGTEEIEWEVLTVEGNKALVISKYALDCQEYNSTYTDTTWEKCTLRTWLNGTFYNAAFGSDHQEMIFSSTVTADKNPSYNTSPGNNTTDKVFLLSINEVNKYFGSDSARQCQGTAFCYAQGACKASNGNCWWWLRSPGDYSSSAAGVNYDGFVSDDGNMVHYDRDAVRPAMWIDLGE